MKTISPIYVVLLLLLASNHVFGFDRTFTFSSSDFSLTNKDGLASIRTKSNAYTYVVNAPGSPNIPFYYYVFNSQNACNEMSLHYTVLDTLLLMTDVEIEKTRGYFFEDSEEIDIFDTEVHESSSSNVYPDSLIRLYNGPMIGDDRIALLVAPFIYDSTSRSLYLATRIRVVYEETDSMISLSTKKVQTRNANDDFDYLIIAPDSLVDVFTRLRDWKTMKGVRTRVVGLGTIEPNSYAEVTPFKIKSYINSCYQTNHIQMVMLAGSPELVPAPTCELVYTTVRRVFSDYYYSCLEGQLDWNGDHDNYIGETEEDGVILTPTISVTRLPFDTKQQAITYIDKLFNYEMNPDVDGQGLRLLLSGKRVSYYDEGKSDAELDSERLFSSAFADGYPDINKFTFYDTNNNLELHGADSLITPFNLYTVINDLRPHFLNMDSYGYLNQWYFGDDFISYYSWSIPDENSFFNQHALELENNGSPMVITTGSWHTSNCAFGYPCLAESFLQHPNGGAIAYWGSSDYAFHYMNPSSEIGPSMAMCEAFWDSLPKFYRFGDAVKIAKHKFVPLGENSNGSYDWLLKSMNALGDCELPIYTAEPNTFDKVIINVSPEALVVVNDDTCCMAYTSRGDNGFSCFYVDSLSENTYYLGNNPQRYNLCLTKRNFIPFVVHTGHYVCDCERNILSLQNAKYRSGTVEYLADEIHAGNHVDAGDDAGDIIVEAGGTLRLGSFGSVKIHSGLKCEKGGKLKINSSDI